MDSTVATSTKAATKRIDLPDTGYVLHLERLANALVEEEIATNLPNQDPELLRGIVRDVFLTIKKTVTVAGRRWPFEQLPQDEPQLEPVDETLARKVENTRVQYDNLVLDLAEARKRVKEQHRIMRTRQQQALVKLKETRSALKKSAGLDEELRRLEQLPVSVATDDAVVASQTRQTFETV